MSPTPPPLPLRRTLALYADRRMPKLLFLGYIQGFPWLLIGSMLALWLKEEGVSRTDIGLFGLLFSVYAVNALWSPLVDKCPLPWLTRRLGQRRAWILMAQAVIAAALAAIYFLPNAAAHPWHIAALMLAIATASATQDIALDAKRIELIGTSEPEKVSPGAAVFTAGFYMGFAGTKLLSLPFAESLQNVGATNAWQSTYLLMGLIVLLCMAGLIFWITPDSPESPESPSSPPESSESPPPPPRYFANPLRLYGDPIAAFIKNYTLYPALLLLAFIFFFKIGEAFLGRMSVIFYQEIGFSKTDIAIVSGGLGFVTFCLFALVGSLLNARYGLLKGIFIAGVAMAATNLLFAALAYHPTQALFVTAVVADQFTTATSTVAFVAFLSQLCDRRHTATHYAALGSLGNLSRTMLAAGSGWMVDSLQTATGDTAAGNAHAWAAFFVITVLMVIPSLYILHRLRPHLAPRMQGATAKLL